MIASGGSCRWCPIHRTAESTYRDRVEITKQQSVADLIPETWVVSEITKYRANLNELNGVYFYRDHNGVEIDIVIPDPERILLTEAKSSTTPSIALLEGAKRKMRHFSELPQSKNFTVVYGGDKMKEINGSRLIPWRSVSSLVKQTQGDDV